MAENKSRAMQDILKREKLAKNLKQDKLAKEKTQLENEKKAMESAVKKISASSHPASSSTSSSNSRHFISSFDIALSQNRQDIRFYFLKDLDYSNRIKDIFQQNEAIFKKYGINGRKYLDYICESFERYKKIHDLMPLEPMKPKHFKYVEESIIELIDMFSNRIGQ